MSFKFEIINNLNKVVMITNSPNCIPSKETIHLQRKAGYKYRFNNKMITLKQIDELRG